MFKNIDTQNIKAMEKELDITCVVEKFLPITKQDENYTTICPFHNTQNKTLIIDEKKQEFYCTDCGIKGTAFEFILNYLNFDYDYAIHFLNCYYLENKRIDILQKICFDNLDNIIGSLKVGELIAITERPDIYNSSLCTSVIRNVSKQTDKKMLYFTLKNSRNNLNKRVISNKVEIIDNIETIEDIKSKCVEMSKQGLSLVIIDSFQFVNTSKKFSTKMEKMDYVSRMLKKLALDLNVPIIILTSLGHVNKRPTIHDTIKFGSLQQDSDKIICLYSDDYYKGRPLNSIELILLKNRSGSLETVKLKFNKDTFTFE